MITHNIPYDNVKRQFCLNHHKYNILWISGDLEISFKGLEREFKINHACSCH